KYNEAKNSLNGSYRFNKLNTQGGGITTSQFILPDTLYYRNERGFNQQQRLRNLVTGSYEMQIDSFTTLKVTANGSIGKTDSYNSNYTESLSEFGQKVNQSDRNTITKADNQSLTTTALLRKRFKKPGRTMSLNFNQTYNNREADGFLYSDNRYFNEDESLKTRDSINQQKQNNNNSLTLAGKVVFTEAITKTFFVEANYSLASSNSSTERVTLANVNGKYEDYIDSLSTKYDFDVLTNRGGLSFRVNKKKYNMSIGSDISSSNFKQTDLLQDTVRNYTYKNLFPRANFTYIMGPQKRLSFFYNGSTRQPTIDQLQPLRDNTDPLNIYRGNPNLNQEFRNTFRLSFNNYKVLNSQSMYGSISLTTVGDAIGTAETFDYALGKRIYQPTNVSGNYNANAYMGYGWKIKKIDLNVNINLDGNTGKNNTVVNGEKNVNTNSNFGGGINLYYFKQKKINLGMWSSVHRNVSKSSIRKEIETKYWSANFNPNATVYLPAKFELGTDAGIDIREKTALFDKNLNVIKWNAWAAKKFFKDESLMLRFEVRDILAQNIGFQRNISSTNITERTYDTLRRFWLISLTYNFNKNGAPPKNPWD
ncbi:MAG TPA: outer membrane beta-barrel protein, partial [Flavitalea sp.]|nr:outer membrane beta-barrel protein [Flavitalea sp.]